MGSIGSFLPVAVVAAAVVVSFGCGRDAAPQPSPASAATGSRTAGAGNFSQYEAVEYGTVRLAASAEQDEESRAAVDKALRECMTKVPAARPASAGKAGTKTLLVEPTITQIRKVSSAARFWGGAFAGNSSITMNVAFKDKATGKSLGSKEFGDSANAFAGAWSFGAGDRSMLEEAAQQVCAYVVASR